jgi:hypothetical protein
MPWLEKRGGTYRMKFRFGGKVRQAALKTGDEVAARTALAKFEETISDVLRGRLKLPDGADVALFLISDGKLDKRPVHIDAPTALTVEVAQKHWPRPDGAESILQLRAAVLSEGGRLERHFAHRPGCDFRKRPRPAATHPQTAN